MFWPRWLPCSMTSKLLQDLTFSLSMSGFHRSGAQWRVNEGQKGHQLSALRANSLRIRTGNFLRPCRELNRAIREIFSLIRESALVHFFGICFDDKCDRPDRPRLCREGEEGAARCSKPLKPISRSNPALVHVKGALGNSGNLAAKFADANKRRFCIRELGTLQPLEPQRER